jgi:hypothetical protein
LDEGRKEEEEGGGLLSLSRYAPLWWPFALIRAFSSSTVFFFLAMAVVVRRKWRRKERVLENIGDDKPDKRSRPIEIR